MKDEEISHRDKGREQIQNPGFFNETNWRKRGRSRGNPVSIYPQTDSRSPATVDPIPEHVPGLGLKWWILPTSVPPRCISTHMRTHTSYSRLLNYQPSNTRATRLSLLLRIDHGTVTLPW